MTGLICYTLSCIWKRPLLLAIRISLAVYNNINLPCLCDVALPLCALLGEFMSGYVHSQVKVKLSSHFHIEFRIRKRSNSAIPIVFCKAFKTDIRLRPNFFTSFQKSPILSCLELSLLSITFWVSRLCHFRDSLKSSSHIVHTQQDSPPNHPPDVLDNLDIPREGFHRTSPL